MNPCTSCGKKDECNDRVRQLVCVFDGNMNLNDKLLTPLVEKEVARLFQAWVSATWQD